MRTSVVTVITGTLVRDAELKYTGKGKAMVSMALPSEIGWGDHKKTIWLNVLWFGEFAEKKAPKLTKGSKVTITCADAEIPDYIIKGSAKSLSLTYVAKDVFVHKYGEAGFKDSFDEGFVESTYKSEFEDEMPW